MKTGGGERAKDSCHCLGTGEENDPDHHVKVSKPTQCLRKRTGAEHNLRGIKEQSIPWAAGQNHACGVFFFLHFSKPAGVQHRGDGNTSRAADPPCSMSRLAWPSTPTASLGGCRPLQARAAPRSFFLAGNPLRDQKSRVVTRWDPRTTNQAWRRLSIDLDCCCSMETLEQLGSQFAALVRGCGRPRHPRVQFPFFTFFTVMRNPFVGGRLTGFINLN
ncbi:hypothetical protein C8F04DRAFT_1173257 [Mycena alexandri]|uniref:Uncharacterized protein n=1 Tax=Mycena alexandri TaxID=1745969 RepID=A0AAD6TJ87_9AGAR|nr:hypothetical protein C8F04DRAFT_1173257 [Mycena alexandri]